MTVDVRQLLETMPEAPEAWVDAQIGRYVFRRLVGTGGMGIVVAAHDPELDREVAIKIVVTGDTADFRPIREAQAMARLSHPNVVQVYEVIRLGPRTAIVMELVEGDELGVWQAGRPWREIVDAYVQASRGLTAAHRAGIVHRDFKPSNVLVDRDGVVRVTDFGLADAEGVADGRSGTPAYMAPEQHRAGTVDARTDQWGFACSLYEGLYGRRPFASMESSSSKLVTAVTRGEIEAEPTDTQVPRRIRAAIRRALATDPEQRFPAVEDFAAALAPRSRRAIYAIGAAVAGATMAIIVLATLGGSKPSPCEGLDAPIRAAWTERVRTDLRARLLTPDVAVPSTTVDKAIAGLDAYAIAWTETRTQACTDTQQGVRSAETLDVRMRCLDHRLAAVSGLLDGLATGDAATLRATGDAVTGLEPATTCFEATELTTRPASEELRKEIDDAEHDVSRAGALISLGRYEQALPILEHAAAASEHANAPAVTAHALVLRAECEYRLAHPQASLVTYRDAAKLAAQARDLPTVADALTGAFLVEGNHIGHRADALRVRPYIELAIDSAGRPDAIRANWLHMLAILLYEDPATTDEAATHEREALAILMRTLPAGHVHIVDSMETLGNIEATRKNFEESSRLLHQVLEARTAARGPRDYGVSAVRSNLGVLAATKGDLITAIDEFALAVEISKSNGHPNLPAEFNLPMTQLQLGRLSAAAPNFADAIPTAERTAGKDSGDAGDNTMFLGITTILLGDYERGRPIMQRGLDLARNAATIAFSTGLALAAHIALQRGERRQAQTMFADSLKFPSDNPPVRALLTAELQRADSGCAVAKPALTKAVDVATAEMGYFVLSIALVALAECEVEAGESGVARQRLEAGLARLESAKVDERLLAPIRAALAKR